MTGRDRIILMAAIVVAILGAGWVLVVSPERNKANSIAAEVTTAQASLATAEGELSKARAAQAQYAAAYSSIVSLGKAVPASKEVPSLILQITRASEQKDVFFSSISSATAGSAGASAPAAAATASTSFTAMPFSFTFGGSFFDLERLMRKLTGFTTRTASGALTVNGRLLTIQSVNLTPSSKEAAGSGSKASSELTGVVTASAYVLPGGQSLTGSSPVPGAGAPTPSATGAPSSPTAPATVSVTP
jgi:Tfp pilus assembly protein PilO